MPLPHFSTYFYNFPIFADKLFHAIIRVNLAQYLFNDRFTFRFPFLPIVFCHIQNEAIEISFWGLITYLDARETDKAKTYLHSSNIRRY